MKLTTKALLAVSAMIMTTPATAAVQLVNAAGKLTGATGVKVGTLVYDVTFVEGTCASVYGSCENNSFDFKNATDATLAANALLDQVFIDTAQGQFDSDPSLTFGCTGTQCDSYITYSVSNSTISSQGSRNFNQASPNPDRTFGALSGVTRDTSISATANFARFIVSGTGGTGAAVPEPATWAMMLIGFGMVGGAVRTRRRAVRIAIA